MAARCGKALRAFRMATDELDETQLADMALILTVVSSARFGAKNTPITIPVLPWGIAPMLLAIFQLLG